MIPNDANDTNGSTPETCECGLLGSTNWCPGLTRANFDRYNALYGREGRHHPKRYGGCKVPKEGGAK